MSNGENNFMDNDAQRDFTVVDTWEEIDEHELNNKLNKIKTRSAQRNEDCNNINTNFTNQTQTVELCSSKSQTTNFDSESLHFSNMMINDGNYQSETSVSQASKFKILKRPTDNGNKISENLPKTKLPLKSLKQREKEYAEARLRILGAAVNPEDVKTSSSSTSSSEPGTMTSETNKNQRPTPNQNQENLNRVLRMPSGPVEGVNGFKIRR